MLSEDERRIRDKRRRLVKLIVEKRKAQLRFLAAHPEMDISPVALERTSSRSDVERQVSRLDESHLDALLAFHDPVSAGEPKCVW